MVGVHDEQRLVGCAREPLLDHAAHFRQLLHQVRLRVQAAGRVDEDDVLAARLGGLDRVVGDRGGVAALLRADDVDLRPLGPDLQLLVGRRAERVGRSEDDREPVLAQLVGQLADRRRLAGAVDPDDQDHAGPLVDGQASRHRRARAARPLPRRAPR